MGHSKKVYIGIMIIAAIILTLKLLGFKFIFGDFEKDKALGNHFLYTSTCRYFGIFNEKLKIAKPFYTIECSNI